MSTSCSDSPTSLRGEQRPRVSHVPAYTSSAGPKAVALAAMAGLQLDPWQQYALEVMLGRKDDGSFAAFETALIVSRQNGKGSVLEARVLAGLFLLDERLILWSAHEYKTAQEGFLRVKTLLEGSDELGRRVKAVRTANGEQGIELKTGARLRFVARSKGSGRGFSGDCVILDEAYELGPETMAALLPTLSSRPNPQIIYASSAGMDSSTQLNRVRERAVSGERAKRLAYLEWSAPREADLDDRHAWAQANPALGIRISEEFIEGERSAMPDLEFARERLSVWAQAGDDAVIPLSTWQELADSDSEPVGDVSFGVDVAPDRATASIATAGARLDGLQHLELVENRDGTRWVVDRVVALCKRWHPRSVVLDPGGPAGSLIPGLQDALEQLGVELVLVSGRQLGQACGAFYDDVLAGKDDPDAARVRHLGQAELDASLVAAKKRPLGDAFAWARKDLAADISPLYAVTLAKYGDDAHGPIDVASNCW